MAGQYINSVAYAAVAKWAASTVYAAGSIVTQVSPSVGVERCFRTALGGTSGSTEPLWAVSTGATNPLADGTVTDWTEVTGQQAYCSPGSWLAPHARVLGALTYECRGSTIPATATGWAVGDYCQSTSSTMTGAPVIMKVTAVSAGKPTAFQLISAGAFLTNIFPGNITASWSALTGTGGAFTTFYSSSTGAQHLSTAGDTCYLSSNHAETVASAITISQPGTVAAPCLFLSVDESASGHIPPTSADMKAGASITTTSAGTITIGGVSAYFWGITFSAGSGAFGAALNLNSGSSSAYHRYENCTLKKLSTTASATAMVFGSVSTTSVTDVIGCTIQFGAVGDQLQIAGRRVLIKNCPSFIQGAVFPTTLINSTQCQLFLEGVDLSALGSGKTIFGTSVSNQVYVKDCLLGASATLAVNGTFIGPEVNFIRCDTGGATYRNEKYTYAGTLTTETTIVRTGGASDGTTPVSWKIVTTANAKPYVFFESLPITVWNDTVGVSKTVTIEGIWTSAGGVAPNNDDIWLEAEYLGTTSSVLGSFVNDTKSNVLSTGTVQATSSATWASSPATPFTFSLSVTFTPQVKGPITLYVKAGKASATFYVDPEPTVV